MMGKKNTEQQAQAFKNQWMLLASELEGIYIEIDKLSKKSPAARVSDLELAGINDLVNLVKQLLQSDPFIDKLKPFVPAGENPEYREGLIVLRQMIQGMNRYAPQYKAIRTK
jgi:hypothetical protein